MARRCTPRTSGLADFLAVDERDGIRLARQCVRRLNWRKQGPPPRNPVPQPPRYDPEELLGIASADLKVPFDPREVLARVAGRQRVRRVQAGATAPRWSPAGASCTATRSACWPTPAGVLFSEEAQKATQFIQLANAADTPLIFLQNTTGYMVGTEYEQRGIIKHGALMINAVSNSTVPHLTVNLGASYGAGNYGMCGRAYEPRFLFTWPNAKSAVMGPAQLAGVLSIVARQAAAARGREYDEDSDAAMRMMVEQQIESQSGRALPLRPALRRRGDRPPGHPYRPRALPLGDPQRTGQGRRRLRRLPDVSRRQSAVANEGGVSAMTQRLRCVANRGEIARRVFATCRALGHRDRRRALRRRRRRAATSPRPTRRSGCPATRRPRRTCGPT